MCVSLYVDVYAFSNIILHYSIITFITIHMTICLILIIIPNYHTLLLRWYSCRMHNTYLLLELENDILHTIATHVHVC